MKNKLLLCIVLFKTLSLLGNTAHNTAAPAISRLDREEDKLAWKEIDQNKQKQQLDAREKNLHKKQQEDQRNSEPSALQKVFIKFGVEAAGEVLLIPLKAACYNYPLETLGAGVVTGGFAWQYSNSWGPQFRRMKTMSDGAAFLASSMKTPGGRWWLGTMAVTVYLLNQGKKWYYAKPEDKRELGEFRIKQAMRGNEGY